MSFIDASATSMGCDDVEDFLDSRDTSFVEIATTVRYYRPLLLSLADATGPQL
jgi:hypothetical protein